MPDKKKRRSIFDLIDELFEEIWEEFEEFERRLRFVTPEEVTVTKPIVYGFRIEIGPNGKPRIYEFGNVKRFGAERPKIIVADETEPLTDVYEEDDSIRVIVELPGVDKEKIKIRAIDDRHLIVEASNHDRKYRKEIELPAEVDVDSAKATFRNGVLEIRLRKKGVVKEGEGKIIKVE